MTNKGLLFLAVLTVAGTIALTSRSNHAAGQDTSAARIATLEQEVSDLTAVVRGLQKHATATQDQLLPEPTTKGVDSVGYFNGDEADKVRLYCSVGETPGMRTYAILDCFQVDRTVDPFRQ